jgi:carbon monoxide dehydrogenase subunit G
MIITSEKVQVQANSETIFKFLKDSNNIHELLPKENISDWNADTNTCSFKVQGGVIISLIQDGDEPFSKVFMKSGEKSPFPFKLTIHIENQNDDSVGYIEFDGEVNMFLKMMVEKPLTNLFNYMSNKLKEQFAH